MKLEDYSADSCVAIEGKGVYSESLRDYQSRVDKGAVSRNEVSIYQMVDISKSLLLFLSKEVEENLSHLDIDQRGTAMKAILRMAGNISSV